MKLSSLLCVRRSRSDLKFVTDTPHCFNVAKVRVWLYFLTKGADMDIDDMSIAIIIVTPDFIHEHFTCVYAVRCLRQQRQQIIFGWRQGYFSVIDLNTTRR